jgi:hypothetical protein
MLPTAEQVLRDGGWPRQYARVLAIGGSEELPLALVDTNGDGFAVEQCFFHRLPDGGWREVSSSGYGTTGYGMNSTCETSGHTLAVGHAEGQEPFPLAVGNLELVAAKSPER